MQYILFIINKLNLLIRKFTSKFSRNKIISCNQFKQNKINNNKNKSIEDKNIKEKSICNTNINKIIQINNAFSINILIFCNRKSKNRSLKLSHFERLKNIKSLSTFLFLNAYFNI
jgi:hypothetical protein